MEPALNSLVVLEEFVNSNPFPLAPEALRIEPGEDVSVVSRDFGHSRHLMIYPFDSQERTWRRSSEVSLYDAAPATINRELAAVKRPTLKAQR